MNILDVVIWIFGIGIGIYASYSFLALNKTKQVDNIIEWLIFACIEAEKALGSKTGKIKLRYVYDLFISKYRFLSMLIPFEVFSGWVDEALEEVRHLIENNKAIEQYIGGVSSDSK